MTTSHIALIPRDGLFCKDGRGWSTSTSGRGHALDWPYPSTVLGALRAAWGRQLERRNNRRLDLDEASWPSSTKSMQLGRTLALHRSWCADSWMRMWPVPADVLVVQDQAGNKTIEHLDPLQSDVPTIGRDGDHRDPRERLWIAIASKKAKPAPRPRWWAEPSFIRWLTQPGEGPLVGTHDLGRRHQTHVSIQSSTRTAIDGALFSHDVVETVEHEGEWAIACEVEADESFSIDLATLGSDRRLTSSAPLPDSLFEMPESLQAAFTQRPAGLRLIAVTPLEFENGWLPDGLEIAGSEYRGTLGLLDCELVLRAALIDRPQAVSGWDMAKRAPKPTSRMVPPGSVFAFERADGKPFEPQHVRALWLTAIGQRTSEGFGRVVPGVWHPNR